MSSERLRRVISRVHRIVSGMMWKWNETMKPVEEDSLSHDQPPLPAMAVLSDGRFALRIGLVTPVTTRVWEVHRWNGRSGTSSEDRTSTGWLPDGYLSDAEVATAAGRPVQPLIDVLALADELEGTGQFAAARLVRERVQHVQDSWAGGAR